MASLDDQIKEAMKTAMKAKEQTTLQTIRMVRAEMQARLNEAGGPTEPNDALWVEVIQSYQKKLKNPNRPTETSAKLAQKRSKTSMLKSQY